MADESTDVKRGALARLWGWLRRPSSTITVLALIAVGFASGVVFWGGFNTVVEATNAESFCISCHEMRDNVYAEYKNTIHYSNRTGVRAVCADCHVPRDWTHKMVRKVQATKELYGKLMGTIDTKEKFEAKRLELARSEWARMKAADSRECRNCHGFQSMNSESQKPRAKKAHELGQRDQQTCIDCHKGIAHKKPQGMTEADEG
jgi:cytochrome c-type protein NapC